LCKDFVIDVWQIYYARSKGADAVLLIAAVLPDPDIKYMLRVCRSLGMTALVEVRHHHSVWGILPFFFFLFYRAVDFTRLSPL
ncbi:hypothetical protein Q6247_25280, partial [Klebsiella pneumoniae]